MGYEYETYTEEEASMGDLLPDCMKVLKIISNQAAISNAGNSICRLNFAYLNDKNEWKELNSVITFTKKWAFLWRHLCDSAGILEIYNDKSKKIEESDLNDKYIVAEIIVGEYTNKYGKKVKQNNILDYIKRSDPIFDNEMAKFKKQLEFLETFNDDLPF